MKCNYPGLETEEVNQIIPKIKESNNGTLAELYKSRLLVFMKKEARDLSSKKCQIVKEKEKGRKENLYINCPVCFMMFNKKYSPDKPVESVHGCLQETSS